MSVMIDEIAEQPAAVEATWRSLRRERDALRRLLAGRRHVLFVARGSSDNAAVYGRYLLESLGLLQAALAAPSIATHYGRRLELSDTCVVSVSQSGETEEIVRTQTWAADCGAATVAVTNDAGSSLADAADDAWEVLRHVMRHASRWAVDPDRAAVFGESCGALICALTAIRARTAGLRLAAQVLVNPAVDVTDTMFDYPSIAEYPATPTLALPQLRLIQRLGVPQGTDATALSPVYADDLSGLAPALVVVPTHDPLADHGRRHAERLRAAGTAVQLTEYPGAQHAFLTLPGVAPQAQAARAEIAGFLRATLAR